jgi:hypothetical protein
MGYPHPCQERVRGSPRAEGYRKIASSVFVSWGKVLCIRHHDDSNLADFGRDELE